MGRALVELTRHECLELLSSQRLGRLAVNGRNAPVIRPVNYVFDQKSQSVVFRSAAGSKLHSLLHATHASFEVDRVEPASRTGWSVIIVGVIEALHTSDDIRRVQALELDSWTPGEKTHWLRIRAWTVSGRRLAETSERLSPTGDPPRSA